MFFVVTLQTNQLSGNYEKDNPFAFGGICHDSTGAGDTGEER